MSSQVQGVKTSKTPRVILIISEKSSGSTILKNEISRHPRVRLIEHTEHDEHETLYWLKAACLLDMSREGFLNGEPPMERSTARKALIRLLESNVPDFEVPDDDERLVFDGWYALCEKFRPIFLEKSPHHIQHWAALSLILRYVQHTDHDVRIVGLVRNPLAMIHSAWRRWKSQPEERQFVWKHSYQNLLRLRNALPGDRLLVVRYEDMVRDPINTMKEVCRFADLPYVNGLGSRIHQHSLDIWKANPIFRLQLDESVAAVAREFGYGDSDMENPPKPSGLRGQLSALRWRWSANWRRLGKKVGRRLRR